MLNGLLILMHFYFIKTSQKNIQTLVDQRQGTVIHHQNGRKSLQEWIKSRDLQVAERILTFDPFWHVEGISWIFFAKLTWKSYFVIRTFRKWIRMTFSAILAVDQIIINGAIIVSYTFIQYLNTNRIIFRFRSSIMEQF